MAYIVVSTVQNLYNREKLVNFDNATFEVENLKNKEETINMTEKLNQQIYGFK